MYSGGHIYLFISIHTVYGIYNVYIYIPGIYTMQPLEGCAAYIIKQEGLGVEVRTTTYARPSDILENPLPCQKRKGCDIWGGLKQLPKLSAHWAHCILKKEKQFMELFFFLKKVKWRIKQTNTKKLQLHQYICQFQVWYAAIY